MNTYPNVTIVYSASDIVLHIDCDASYRSLPHARGRAIGNYFLSNKSSNPLPSTAPSRSNGPIYVLCKLMRNILASAAESEIAAFFTMVRMLPSYEPHCWR